MKTPCKANVRAPQLANATYNNNNNKKKMVRGVVVGEQSQSNQIILMFDTLGRVRATRLRLRVKLTSGPWESPMNVAV